MVYLLETFYYDGNGEHRGFTRTFDSQEQAEEFTRNNMCGSRHTITPVDYSKEVPAQLSDDATWQL